MELLVTLVHYKLHSEKDHGQLSHQILKTEEISNSVLYECKMLRVNYFPSYFYIAMSTAE